MDRSMDNMMPSPYRGRGYRGGGQQWRGGAYSGGRRSSDFYEQQFASPYQDNRNSPADRNSQRRSYGRGSPSAQFQGNQGGWQNNGRSSYGSARGTPGSSYKKRNQYGQQSDEKQ
ncbi:hypothetical protein OESDEN_07770 [Oesophagostomum dentatum]|uniref:Uncharacterized protein n=1 Tax=Oesophagostomum dentatum TaxID=61180 RepID=A0A0B1T949_OESDE|nr:hypothetical protein OESDEN_07770 [Oesophagostomum dentatum]